MTNCEKRELVIFRVHENGQVDLVGDSNSFKDLQAIRKKIGELLPSKREKKSKEE